MWNEPGMTHSERTIFLSMQRKAMALRVEGRSCHVPALKRTPMYMMILCILFLGLCPEATQSQPDSKAHSPAAVLPLITSFRHVFFAEDLGQVCELVRSPKNKEIIVVGTAGAAFLSEDLSHKRSVVYKVPSEFPAATEWRAVDLDGDTVPEILQCGATANAREIRAYDLNGSIRWRCPVPAFVEHGGINWVQVCHVDGKCRIWAGNRRKSEVFAIDGAGSIVDKQEWDIIPISEYALCTLDIDNDKSEEIIYGTDDRMVCRKADGTVVFSRSMKEHGDFINSVYAAPMLDDADAKGLHVGIAQSKTKRSNDFFFTAQLHPPFITKKDERDLPHQNMLGNIPLRIGKEERRVWCKPAMAMTGLPGNVPVAESGLFVRVFNPDGISIDGVPIAINGPDRSWYFSTTPALQLRLPSAESDSVLVLSNSDLFLFEFKVSNVSLPTSK